MHVKRVFCVLLDQIDKLYPALKFAELIKFFVLALLICACVCVHASDRGEAEGNAGRATATGGRLSLLSSLESCPVLLFVVHVALATARFSSSALLSSNLDPSDIGLVALHIHTHAPTHKYVHASSVHSGRSFTLSTEYMLIGDSNLSSLYLKKRVRLLTQFPFFSAFNSAYIKLCLSFDSAAIFTYLCLFSSIAPMDANCKIHTYVYKVINVILSAMYVPLMFALSYVAFFSEYFHFSEGFAAINIPLCWARVSLSFVFDSLYS